MIRLFPRGALRAHVRTLAAALGTTGSLLMAPVLLLGTTAAHAQAVYPTADAAASAFVDALARNDEDALKHVLGNDFHRFIPAEGIGEDDIYQFLGAWSKGHQIVEDPVKNKGRATAHLAVGDSGWTLPIPLVQAAHGWRFDPPAAQDEMLTRRIGRNERAAILTSLAYLDAQYDYHNLTQHYAQRFVSTPGQHDGLYWVTAPGETESPLGPLAATMPNGTLPTRITGLDESQVEQLLAYERAHGDRLPVVQVLETRLEALRSGAQPSGDQVPDTPEVGGSRTGSPVTPETSGPPVEPLSRGIPADPQHPGNR